MDSARLVRLDAGSRHHAAFAVEPVPTLDQALQLCAALGLWANVEIKPAAGHEVATGRVVARHAAAAGCRLVLSSFSVAALQAAAAEAPQLPRALLVESISADWRERVTGLGAIALHCSARGLTAGIAAAVRADGFPLACYTINRRDEAERLFAMGVSAVFSDRPDLWAPAEM
jgi:glycerophosphoryl diester phosphodiesterase